MNEDGALNIKFATFAELSGARAQLESIERSIGAAKIAGKEYKTLEEQAARMRAAINAAGKPGGGEIFQRLREGLDVVPGFAKLDSIISKFAGGVLGAVAGGFMLLAGGLTEAKKSLVEYAAAEHNVAQLDAALAQRNLLTNEYRETLQALAEQLQGETSVAGERWLGVLTRLTQFGAKPENIKQYTEAVKNFAGIVGDVETAATLFSRALEGDVSMLHRYGIHVDETKTKSEQLQQAMEQMALKGAGQLEAAGKSLAGQWTQLGNTGADLRKNIGRIIAESGLLQGGIGLVSDAFRYWGEKIDGTIPKLVGLSNKAGASSFSLLEAADAARGFARSLDQVAKAGAESAAAIDHNIQRLQALQSMQDALEDAQMAADLAQVGGEGSEAIAKKAAIRKKYAEQKFQRAQAETEQEIKTNDQAYTQKAGQVLGTSQLIAEQKDKIAQRRKGFDAAQAELQEAEAATAEAAGKHAQESVKRDQYRTTGLPYSDDYFRASLDELNHAKRIEGDARRKVRGFKSGPESVEKLQQELDQFLTPLLEKRQAELEQAFTRKQGNDVLRDRLRFNERTHYARSFADSLESQTQMGKARAQEKQESDRQTMEDVKHGFAPGARDIQGVGRDAKRSLEQYHREVIQIIEGIGEVTAGNLREIQQLKRDVNNLESRASNGRSLS